MKVSKEIKEKPFAKYSGADNCHFAVLGEKIKNKPLYVFDFIPNPKRASASAKPFRVVIDKENADYSVITELKSRAGRYDLTKFSNNLYYAYPEIDQKTEQLLRTAMGFTPKTESNNHFLRELVRWTHEVREENLKQTRLAKNDFEDDYVDSCPEALPGGFTNWIRESVLPEDKTIVYTKGGWSGTCFVCGRKVRARGITERFSQSFFRSCPDCGAKVSCVLSNGALWKASYVENVACMQKDENNVVWFRLFHLKRDITARYENIENYLTECARYAMKSGAVAYWQCFAKESRMWGAQEYKLRWWQRNRRFSIYDGWYKFYSDDVDKVADGTHLQYFELSKYLIKTEISPNIITYAQQCSLYPVMEFLFKGGYYRVINDKLHRGSKHNQSAILWQRKSLKECFKFPLSILKLLKPGEWTIDYIHRANELLKVLKPQQITREILLSSYNLEHLLQALRYMSFERYCKYIKSGADYRASTYRDYLQECETLKFDMTDKQILFPKDLQAAHNRTMAMVDYETNKEKYIKFEKVAKSLDKFCFDNGMYIIRPAHSPAELKQEGKILHHCVGGYVDRMADKKTAIFFVRSIAEPDKPFYTLELQNKRIVQCRTTSNKSYEAEPAVKSFVDMWLATVILKQKINKSA